jgi:hypothetical protein
MRFTRRRGRRLPTPGHSNHTHQRQPLHRFILFPPPYHPTSPRLPRKAVTLAGSRTARSQPRCCLHQCSALAGSPRRIEAREARRGEGTTRMRADMLDCNVLVRRKQNRRLVSPQPLAPKIWGMVVIRTCRARNGLTLPPHEPSQFPPVAPARPAGSHRHRAELLAVDDPRDQQRSQSCARKEDRPGHLRRPDGNAAHG